MTYDNIKELIRIIDASTLAKFELEIDNVTIKLEKPSLVACNSSHSVPTVDEKADVPNEFDNAFVVTSPIVGTFYNASSPESAPFVNLGDDVDVGDTLCIIEAMKIMNEITCLQKGKILEILVENGQMVEYGQPLMRIL